MKLREGESQITQCVLEDAFTATLTNFRLIIESSISEESYPLAGITGIAVVDDVEGYKKKKSESQTNKIIVIAQGAFLGLILSIALIIILGIGNGLGLFLVIGVVGGGFGFYKIFVHRFKKIELESFLEIMQAGGAKRFTYIKTDDNTRAIKEFVNRITNTMK